MDRMTKALKTTWEASASSHRRSLRNVLHLEMAMQRVLAALPLADLQTFLSVCGDLTEVAWLLKDSTLWEELLLQHFGGRRHIAPEALAEDQEAGDNGWDRPDESSDDEDDEESEANGTVSDEGASDTAVAATTTVIEPTSTATAVDDIASVTMLSTLPASLTVWVTKNGVCDLAREFMASLIEWMHFQERVVVLRADIYTIQDVQGHSIDGIAFPGDSSMRNPRIGAAGAMFRRAGNELDQHTSRLSMSLQAGQCCVTPGFNSGARVLIHCHGPYNAHPRLFVTLAKTYRNVLRKAKQENVECLAITSISTGNLGVPVPEASRTAMQTIQQYVRAHPGWQGRIGIVCYEPDVYQAFRDERQRVLDAFNVLEQTQ